jgi:hypothetical protein
MSPVGPGLATWAHDRIQVVERTSDGALTPGFLRFDWQEAFVAATGVGDPDAIEAATLSLHASVGDAQTVELRRTLQSWRDADTGGDWNQNPTGGTTWRDHAHPDQRWNQAGAAALGGTGATPGDYNSAYDLAGSVDAVGTLPAINTRTTFASPEITAAYQFWFAHPDLDYGHAIRLRHEAPAQPFVAFVSSEEDLRWNGPVLAITYSLDTAGVPPPDLAHAFLPLVRLP